LYGLNTLAAMDVHHFIHSIAHKLVAYWLLGVLSCNSIFNKLCSLGIKGQDKINQSQLSDHMSTYRKFLQSKYKSLELISIDEQLDCSSSKYVSLTLVKIDRQGRPTSTENRRGDSVTLSAALNVEGEVKKVILIKGDPGMGKSIYPCHKHLQMLGRR